MVYTVYTLDRTVGSEEDTINREELKDSRKEIGLAACMLTFLIGSYILAKEGMLIFALGSQPWFCDCTFLPRRLVRSTAPRIQRIRSRWKSGSGWSFPQRA